MLLAGNIHYESEAWLVCSYIIVDNSLLRAGKVCYTVRKILTEINWVLI